MEEYITALIIFSGMGDFQVDPLKARFNETREKMQMEKLYNVNTGWLKNHSK